MQLLIFLFPSLLLYILAYHLLVPMLPDRAYIISIRPQLPSPQPLLYFRARSKYFSRRYTLYDLHYLFRTVHRHTLHQKMDVVFVGPDLKECDLIPVANSQADLFEFLVYFGAKYNSSVLRRTDYVIKKYRYVMALVNEAAHSHSILSQQAAGNLPRRD